MAGETIITLIGNLTADPELRYTQNGLPVSSFNVASTPRTFDRSTNEWRDGDPLFIRCNAWRDLAEHVAGSLAKGMRVIVQGRLTQRSYQTREGENRTSLEVEVEEVGPSLRFATATVTRTASHSAHAGRGHANEAASGYYSPDAYSGAQNGSYGSGTGPDGDWWQPSGYEVPF